MKKPAIIFIAVAVLIGVGLVTYAVTKPNVAPQANIPTNSPLATVSSSPGAPAAGAYVDYRDGIIQDTAGTKILFFHAPWCPQCRKLEQSIKAGAIPAGVTIIKIDYDSNQDLRKKYGVTIQTSLVKVDDNGALVKRYVAYDEPTLGALEANLLK